MGRAADDESEAGPGENIPEAIPKFNRRYNGMLHTTEPAEAAYEALDGANAAHLEMRAIFRLAED